MKPASQNAATASTIGVEVGPARDRLGDVVRGDELAGAGEAGRGRQVGVDRPPAGEPAELLVGAARAPPRCRAPSRSGSGRSRGRRRRRSAARPRWRSRSSTRSRPARRRPGGRRAGRRSRPTGHPRRRRRGRPPSSGRSQIRAESTWKCVAAVVDELAGVQRADDLDGLDEHLLAGGDARPALADDVLVEALAAAEAEREPAVGQDLQRRGLLRDDGGVVAQGRAGHVGHQLDPLGGLGDGAEHRPRVRRVTLLGEPRRVVVARDLEVEADPLGLPGVAHQLLRAALLGHEGVAEARHARSSVRVGRSVRQWWRRASMSSSLSIEERPSMSSSAARSRRSSTLQSS